eukprot:5814014-Amphidinium_carterae.1
MSNKKVVQVQSTAKGENIPKCNNKALRTEESFNKALHNYKLDAWTQALKTTGQLMILLRANVGHP